MMKVQVLQDKAMVNCLLTPKIKNKKVKYLEKKGVTSSEENYKEVTEASSSDDDGQQELEKSNALRRVVFGTIDIVELIMIQGDHPSCKYGAPVQLSSDEQGRTKMDIDEYQILHPSPRRSRKELYLTSVQRRRM
jgi:hypothetical protein